MIDWLTWVFPEDSTVPDQLMRATGYGGIEAAGRYRYGRRVQGEGICVLSDGPPEAGRCVEITGDGLRHLEDRKGSRWVLDWLLYWRGYCTRLDLARDWIGGAMDLERLARAVRRGRVRGRARNFLVMNSGRAGEVDACTVYAGSPKSERRVRFYDKGAEQGIGPRTQWIRAEVQLRKKSAQRAVDAYRAGGDIEGIWRGEVEDLVQVCTSSRDSNRNRWEVARWWSRAFASFAPGEPFNVDVSASTTLERRAIWVADVVSPCLAELEVEFGEVWLQRMLEQGRNRFAARTSAESGFSA